MERLAGQTRPGQTLGMINSITEAKAQLSALIERVAKGETIVIGRAGKPIAKLVPWSPTQENRKPGALRGKIKIAADFDELPADIASAFGVEARR
jgi:prevent-host-death family protein